MTVAIVTGSFGLVGSSAVDMLTQKFDLVVGIDNDRRASFFGQQASVYKNGKKIVRKYSNYIHVEHDIKDRGNVLKVFRKYGHQIEMVVHTAAQPSHDWAATDVLADFTINATGTLILLELTRQFCPNAVFIFTSTNKVYGDTPNLIKIKALSSRFETTDPAFANGIDETMSIDNSKHSLFGVSKASADLLVQEYGKYFGMRTGIFRCGCISGAAHAGSQQHGFLSYLMKCAVEARHYTVIGYGGKQVRDNIEASDLCAMFWQFYLAPRPGEVYNAGGGRQSNCSVLEAIKLCEEITRVPMHYSFDDTPRSGDHQWYISDTAKFRGHYPDWKPQFGVRDILNKIYHYLHQ